MLDYNNNYQKRTIDKFSQKTMEKINFYVYLLVDPRTNEIFYVGKGKGNRIFSHVKGDLNNPQKEERLSLIKEIIEEGKEVKHYIVRHGLNEETAYEIEATLIDLLSFKDFENISKITNIVAGHGSFERGIKTVKEIENLYAAEPLKEIKHNLLLININKTYKKAPSIYEATRKSWKLNFKNLKKIEYVLAEYRGIIRAIFKPIEWFVTEDGERKYFVGEEVKDKEICSLYLNKEYTGKKKGQQNPVCYLWKKDFK